MLDNSAAGTPGPRSNTRMIAPSPLSRRRHDAVEQRVVTQTLSGQSQRRIDTRQRRTELVRDIRDELALTRDEPFDAPSHEVEVANQLADLVVPGPWVLRARRQVTFRHRRAAPRSRSTGAVKDRVSIGIAADVDNVSFLDEESRSLAAEAGLSRRSVLISAGLLMAVYATCGAVTLGKSISVWAVRLK
jgi:hypothetical protein